MLNATFLCSLKLAALYAKNVLASRRVDINSEMPEAIKNTINTYAIRCVCVLVIIFIIYSEANYTTFNNRISQHSQPTHLLVIAGYYRYQCGVDDIIQDPYSLNTRIEIISRWVLRDEQGFIFFLVVGCEALFKFIKYTFHMDLFIFPKVVKNNDARLLRGRTYAIYIFIHEWKQIRDSCLGKQYQHKKYIASGNNV